MVLIFSNFERLVLQRISPSISLPRQSKAFLVRPSGKNETIFEQVAALTSYIESGFQQNLKTGAVFLESGVISGVWHCFGILVSCLNWARVRMPLLLVHSTSHACSCATDASGCIGLLAMTQAPGDPNVIAMPPSRFCSRRCCSTCTPVALRPLPDL